MGEVKKGGHVRFEVSKVLDAIEARLSTDPALARAVVDLSEIVRYADLDGGRPASSVQLGLVIDALSAYLAEENVPVYVVVPRGLLSDTDLTSNERMVIRRWADDGKVEVVPQADDRVFEGAELLGGRAARRAGPHPGPGRGVPRPAALGRRAGPAARGGGRRGRRRGV